MEACIPRIQAMHDAAKNVNPVVLVLCHGGPISEPEDAAAADVPNFATGGATFLLTEVQEVAFT